MAIGSVFALSPKELIVGGAIWLILTLTALPDLLRGKFSIKQAISFSAFVLGMESFFVIGFHITSLPMFDISRLEGWLNRHPLEKMTLYCPLIVGALGLTAHWFRTRSRRYYGLCEVVFGLVAATKIASDMVPLKNALAVWIGFGSCTYIVTRGLTNIAETGTHIDIFTFIRWWVGTVRGIR